LFCLNTESPKNNVQHTNYSAKNCVQSSRKNSDKNIPIDLDIGSVTKGGLF